MPILFQTWIMRQDLRANPSVLYVFGDNEARVGLGGQAKEMRGEPNAHGVATLRSPGVFWTDENLGHQMQVIEQDILPLFKEVEQGRLIVIPSAGVGTGLSSLETAAPKTFTYLNERFASLIAVSGRL